MGHGEGSSEKVCAIFNQMRRPLPLLAGGLGRPRTAGSFAGTTGAAAGVKTALRTGAPSPSLGADGVPLDIPHGLLAAHVHPDFVNLGRDLRASGKGASMPMVVYRPCHVMSETDQGEHRARASTVPGRALEHRAKAPCQENTLPRTHKRARSTGDFQRVGSGRTHGKVPAAAETSTLITPERSGQRPL